MSLKIVYYVDAPAKKANLCLQKVALILLNSVQIISPGYGGLSDIGGWWKLKRLEDDIHA